jgi:hypothetical protein
MSYGAATAATTLLDEALEVSARMDALGGVEADTVGFEVRQCSVASDTLFRQG